MFTEQHQFETLLVHDSDHICTVHGAQVLAGVTYHLYLTLRDLAANSGDCGMSSGILLFFLRCRSLFCVVYSRGEWRPSPGGSNDVKSFTAYVQS